MHIFDASESGSAVFCLRFRHFKGFKVAVQSIYPHLRYANTSGNEQLYGGRNAAGKSCANRQKCGVV